MIIITIDTVTSEPIISTTIAGTVGTAGTLSNTTTITTHLITIDTISATTTTTSVINKIIHDTRAGVSDLLMVIIARAELVEIIIISITPTIGIPLIIARAELGDTTIRIINANNIPLIDVE